MEGGSPTVRRRRLGRALRALREQAGMTGSTAGVAVERSGSWISRVEGGRVGLRARDLYDLLDLYDVRDPKRREELAALAREGKQRGWWSRYSEELPEQLIVYIGLEEEARMIRSYHDGVVPGLLQTERYCRAVVRQSSASLGPMSKAGIEARVQLRMARQARARRESMQLQFLIDEAVLHREIGGAEILGEQLEHLSRVAREPHIDLRVIPFTHGDRIITTSPFIIMGFSQDPDIVWIESPVRLQYLDGGEEVETYRRMFERMAMAALDSEDTSELISNAKGKLR